MPDFKKLMRQQVQEALDGYREPAKKPIPQKGWMHTIREALGMSSTILAKRLKKSRANVTQLEQSEQKKTISLKSLEQVAQALNCKLVYCLVPNEPLDKILEAQARKIARHRIKIINHSMQLEQQGLNSEQIKEQELDLIQELLQGNPKNLWGDDEI